ncbi:MAG: SDR family oxidoreductase [Pseudomonadota bacterium]
MNIVVFGASGSVGRHLVSQALDEGHRVTAFVRTRSRLALEHSRLRLCLGDVLVQDDVDRAIAGQDAVLVSLGGGLWDAAIRSIGTRHIVQAMARHGVPRLVCQTTLGIGESWQNLTFYWKYLMFRGLLRRVFNDHVAQEEIVRESETEWTIIRPAAFTDGERSGDYRHGFSGRDRDVTLKIARADVADFMLRELRRGEYVHCAASLSY